MLGSQVALLSVCVFSVVSTYDPDVDLSVPEIIKRHGYPSEAHVVLTIDGYLLTVHRIPYGVHAPEESSQRPVVFLQHGMLSSSADWIVNGPEKSLAYYLADNGYDVWMGNARGNTYSKAHTLYPTNDVRFWNFTWSEMAQYDLPAELDYILSRTKVEKLYYIGHSMGTTMFFALTSSKPEYNERVRAMFALAPVAFVEHMKSPIRLIAPWADDLEFISNFLGDGAFLPQNKILRLWSRFGCLTLRVEEEICQSVMFILCGFDKTQFNMTSLPLILSHSPAGASTKTLAHYAQEISSGKFQEYDYGKWGNMKMYNASTPPEFNLTAITTPVGLYYADNDWLASELDVTRLYQQLGNTLGKTLIPYPGFNHLDFIWGKDARTLVYQDILRQMKKIQNTIACVRCDS